MRDYGLVGSSGYEFLFLSWGRRELKSLLLQNLLTSLHNFIKLYWLSWSCSVEPRFLGINWKFASLWFNKPRFLGLKCLSFPLTFSEQNRTHKLGEIRPSQEIICKAESHLHYQVRPLRFLLKLIDSLLHNESFWEHFQCSTAPRQ